MRVGISIGDSLAGLHAVIGALMALQHRHKTGKGQVVDVALYESVFNMMESLLPLAWKIEGKIPKYPNELKILNIFTNLLVHKFFYTYDRI